MYIGGIDDAYNLGLLTELGITHVLDCASAADTTSLCMNCGYSTVYRRMRLGADDDLNYQIINDFEKSYHFIEDATRSHGRILVHCVQGVNRSAAVCIAYIMRKFGRHLCEVVKDVREKRQRSILTNSSFRSQLEQFSRTLIKSYDELDTTLDNFTCLQT